LSEFKKFSTFLEKRKLRVEEKIRISEKGRLFQLFELCEVKEISIKKLGLFFLSSHFFSSYLLISPIPTPFLHVPKPKIRPNLS